LKISLSLFDIEVFIIPHDIQREQSLTITDLGNQLEKLIERKRMRQNLKTYVEITQSR